MSGRAVACRSAPALVQRSVLAIALIGVAAGCEGAPERTLPRPADLEQDLYGPTATVELRGNVLDVRVEQDPAQLRRGGELWAKVGPYIYLFSPQTQELFGRFTGLAAVRVRTFANGQEVAQAMLRRDELNALTWPEAIETVGLARTEGTRRPSYMEELVDYGEEHTDHSYNPRYVSGEG